MRRRSRARLPRDRARARASRPLPSRRRRALRALAPRRARRRGPGRGRGTGGGTRTLRALAARRADGAGDRARARRLPDRSAPRGGDRRQRRRPRARAGARARCCCTTTAARAVRASWCGFRSSRRRSSASRTRAPTASIADRSRQRSRARSTTASGILTVRDLAAYRPHWRTPVRASYRGLEVFTMPPPSSGGVLVEILNILAHDDLAALGRASPDYLHLLAEAMKHGFADRARWYGDPAFTRVPVARLTSPAYARTLRARIRTDRDPAAGAVRQRARPRHDAPLGRRRRRHARSRARRPSTPRSVRCSSAARAASSSTTRWTTSRSRPGVPNAFGLIGGEANAVAPGKRPLSSMSPVIARHPAARAGTMPSRLLVAGGSGGPLIISGTLQALLGSIDFGLDAAAAVAAPRIHDQWAPAGARDRRADRRRRPAPTSRAAATRSVRCRSRARCQVVGYGDGRFDAGADPRKHGGAVVRDESVR